MYTVVVHWFQFLSQENDGSVITQCIHSSIFSSLLLFQEAERQRRMEWEKSKRVELQTQREKEQSDIQRLKDRKRILEMELEAVVRLPFLHSFFLFFLISYTCSPFSFIHPFFCGINGCIILQFKNILVFSSSRVTSISRSPIASGTPRVRGRSRGPRQT